ncbi:MAG: RdgB/HAM1 family non-canonical purine NTP pyrophosphatase [Myxococcota bacterium]
MKVRLLVATGNRGKLAELRRLFAGLELEVVGLDAVGPVPEVVEDGDTFEANAAKKAREVAAATGEMTLADDSGLEVDALGGAPGVRSARFAGEGATDAENNRLLLERLEATGDAARTGRFRCVLALADPPGPLGDRVHLEAGACEGRILRAPRGEGGFGYDPLFVPRGHERTMAELPADEKNRLSHRGAAAARMRRFLATYLTDRAERR